MKAKEKQKLVKSMNPNLNLVAASTRNKTGMQWFKNVTLYITNEIIITSLGKMAIWLKLNTLVVTDEAVFPWKLVSRCIKKHKVNAWFTHKFWVTRLSYELPSFFFDFGSHCENLCFRHYPHPDTKMLSINNVILAWITSTFSMPE